MIYKQTVYFNRDKEARYAVLAVIYPALKHLKLFAGNLQNVDTLVRLPDETK